MQSLRSPFAFPRRMLGFLSALAFLLMSAVLMPASTTAQDPGTAFSITQWDLVEFIQPQPACTGVGYVKNVFARKDCGFGRVYLSPAVAGKSVTVEVINANGTLANSQTVQTNASGQAQFNITPTSTWQAGEITVRATVAAPDSGSGETTFLLNPLEVTLQTAGPLVPGEDIVVSGLVNQLDSTTCCLDQREPVPATVEAMLHAPDGTPLSGTASATADADGNFALTFPGSATADLQATVESNFELELAVRAEAHYQDPTPYIGADGLPAQSGEWAGTGAGAVVVRTPPDSLLIENSFVSSVGWVKPGDTYPFRVFVKNYTPDPASNVVVTIPSVPGTTFTRAEPLNGAGSAAVNGDGSVTWTVGQIEGAVGDGAVIKTLVVEAKAATTSQDPEVVWKDISSTAHLSYDGAPGSLAATSHGPKVIPAEGGFETARYGDKPFPIVPVDYTDRKHEARHSGDALARVVNSPDVPGSTFNLYQEMSYGQLFPIGTVPSTGIATADFTYEHGFDFTQTDLTKGTCRGTTFGTTPALIGSPLYNERISDGWYQLPGDTEYYGGDYPVFSLGVGGQIDSACGPTGKAVYDAAAIADPEIDYNQFDSDKDGVVDFFMMVFTGMGGNGASQINGTPPYDNIWPHSSSLEFYFEDENGLAGYVSDDQLTDLTGTPQCWVSEARSTFDDCAAHGGTGQDHLPALVRVGPYNVNPEDAIDHASVISHEYGHHLGLPDFYASYSAYNDWNLMASDYSQHMTIFGKQEMGWVVPQFLQPGEQVNIPDWEEIKNDTGEISWQRPDGTFYTLSAANGDQNVHNGQAFGVKLPPRQLIDPAKVEEQASAPYLWYSGRGNDFGCAPEAGHNLDVALPELENLPAGTTVTLRYKSSWDIEWDWDYGFTMVTTDGASYTALPSQKGYTSDNGYNPNGAGCFNTYNNGLTGQSGTYQKGTQSVERLSPSYADGSPFLVDEYDLSAYAGQQNVVLRFSYYTDAGFDRPGWFIDDLEILANGQVIYASDFTEEDDLRYFPGGCNGNGLQTAENCTAGWSHINADAGSDLDHGYYLELRDRSGFDFNGRGQSDRGDIGWEPGVLIEYTDEARGYGNNGGSQPPNQHYLDSQPEPGLDCGDNLYEENPPGVLTDPRCQDAAFTATAGDNHFDDTDWVDNFHDESSDDGLWHFNYACLSLDVTGMAGHQNNSEALPSDLTASATLTAAEGCFPFDYGVAGGGQQALADLQVVDIVAVNNTGGGKRDKEPRSGDKVTLSATIKNLGESDAAASVTQFLLDDSTGLGEVETASLAAGEETTIALEWDTRGLSGEHTIRVTADGNGQVEESSETNNVGLYTVTVKGNKVQNGSFEQPNSSGSAPANWSASNTQAGTTSWDEDPNTGEHSISIHGNGGNALLFGSPAWKSAPVPVTVGEVLTLAGSINAAGASSTPTIGLAYLNAAGAVLNTVTLITAPLDTGGLIELEHSITIPLGVSKVQVVLSGFAPTDLVTAGSVTFDNIGLFED